MEVEAKFGVPDQNTFEQLVSVDRLAGLVVSNAEIHTVSDSYLDTADLAFFRRGFACRVRDSGDRALVTLKGLGRGDDGLHSRQELEASVEPGGGARVADWPPGPTRDLAEEIAKGKPLQVLFVVSQERHVRLLREKVDGSEAIELSLDQVRLGGPESQVFYECEAELLPDGHMGQLLAVMEALRNQWQLDPESRSKFERGLTLARPGLVVDKGDQANPSNESSIRPDDHMAEAVRKILAQQLQEMVAHQEGSRSGEDIDDLHDMRVATRRMRAAFRLFGSYFQPKSIRRIKKDLRRTGRTLGAVRDLDVFNKKASSYLKGLPKEERHGLDPLLDHWHEQRETARQALVAYLDSQRYQRFVVELGTFVATHGAGVEPVPPGEPVCVQVRHVLGSSVWQLAEKVRAYEVVLDDAPKSTLHALRIDCKRLRYTLEFFQGVLGSETPGLVRDVVAIQDHLGDVQDAEVATGLLEAFVQERKGESDSVELAGVVAYLDYRRAEGRDLVATFPELWSSVNNMAFRERLAQAIVSL